MATVGTGLSVTLPVLLPLAGAALAFVLGSRVAAVAVVSTLVALCVPAAVVALIVRTLERGPLVYPVGGWGRPWASSCTSTASARRCLS